MDLSNGFKLEYEILYFKNASIHVEQCNISQKKKRKRNSSSVFKAEFEGVITIKMALLIINALATISINGSTHAVSNGQIYRPRTNN